MLLAVWILAALAVSAGERIPGVVAETGALPATLIAETGSINATGYWLVASDGGIFNFGDARFFGSTGALRLNQPIVAMAASPSGQGYWLVASDGGIFNFGDARFFGSTGAIKLNQPIVGMARTPSGNGYWLVASDGGIFNFGDARFFGSTGALKLNRPIVGLARTPSGNGYWLVASDGGIFNFGDARFFGSTGALKLNQPIAGLAPTPSGNGYWLVASDGGIFNFGDARFFGSTGALKLNQPIAGTAASPSGSGYWLVASDGGMFNFGDAKFFGSTGALKLNRPIVGMERRLTFVPTPPPTTTPPTTTPARFRPVRGIKVQGNQLVDGGGTPVRLQGVNRMSSEYSCTLAGGFGIFHGPNTAAEQERALDAMLAWNINVVRVPMNEDCWFGTKPGSNPTFTGAPYRAAILDWVSRVTARGMVAIADLHWAAPNGTLAQWQQPMANRNNSPTFWSQVAAALRTNPNVIFDLFNEPYLERDPSQAGLDPWNTWRNGGTLHVANADQGLDPAAPTFVAAGMQELVSAVRAAGATNPIMLGGLSYAQDLSGMLSHLPSDPAGQLVASFHPYPGNPCDWNNLSCLRSRIDAVAAAMPVVAGEFGRSDCSTAGVKSLLDLLDSYGGGRVSYLAWVWTITAGNCGASDYGLMTDYYSGNPTLTGAAIRQHYLGLDKG